MLLELTVPKVHVLLCVPELFDVNTQGFLPKIMEEMYEDRKKYKKMMIEAKKEYEVEKDENRRRELEKKIAQHKLGSRNSDMAAVDSKN